MDQREQADVEDHLRRQIDAYHDAALVFTAITAGIPDVLKAGPQATADLARELGLSASHLHRFLRGLVMIRLCEEQQDGRFALTPAGHALAAGPGSSLREKTLVVLGQYWLPWLELLHCLETGEPSFPGVFAMPVSDWRRDNAEHAKLFHSYVAKEEVARGDDILQAFDALEAGTLASIGGGYGGLLMPFLSAFPDLEAVVFDESPIVEAAKPLFEAFGVADRVQFVGGDILAGIPVEADIYLLKGVLQQHDDTQVRAILANCREAMGPGAELVVIERLMPARVMDDPAAVMLDLHMMAIAGGRARTKAEIQAMLEGAGLSVTGVSATNDGLSLIKAARS